MKNNTTPKVYTIKSNQKSTNKCLDKYINSKIKGEDNSFLNSTLKSSDLGKTLKGSQDKTPKLLAKPFNEQIPQFQLEVGHKKRPSMGTLDMLSNKTVSQCNYDTSAEEFVSEDFRMGMDNVKALLFELLSDGKNRHLVVKELDEIYRNLNDGEGVDMGDINITQHSKTISIFKEQPSISSNIITELESLKNENQALKKRLDEGDIRYTKLALENERLKNEVRSKSASHDSMQKTLFQFQSNLNELGKSSGGASSGFNTSKSKNFFTPVVSKGGTSHQIRTPKPEAEPIVDRIVDSVLNNDQVRNIYYLPKKVIQKHTKHELPRLYFVSTKYINY
jgi:hypothetical protein